MISYHFKRDQNLLTQPPRFSSLIPLTRPYWLDDQFFNSPNDGRVSEFLMLLKCQSSTLLLFCNFSFTMQSYILLYYCKNLLKTLLSCTSKTKTFQIQARFNDCGSGFVSVAGTCSKLTTSTGSNSSSSGSIVGAVIGILVVLFLVILIYFNRLVS